MEQSAPLPKRRSIRLKGFDYAQAGMYFVTVCTHNRRCLFGEIRNGAMHLNAMGNVVRECWIEIPRHFPSVELHAYVVMPNHIHGILVIFSRARHAVPLRQTAPTAERFGKPVSRSLPTIVRSFKSAVTRRVRAMHKSPLSEIWQRGYYESVIRPGDQFNDACRYVWENPSTWAIDEENPDR